MARRRHTLAAKKATGPAAPGPDTSARMARLAAAALNDPKASAREKALAGNVLVNTRPGTVPKPAAKGAPKSAVKPR
jgi:hypothetical protein